MSARGKQDGFIIVSVLWMVAALAVLAAIYTRFALTTAVASTVHEDRLRAQGLITAAVELTAYQLTAELPQSNKAGGSGFPLTDTAQGSQPGTAQGPQPGTAQQRLQPATTQQMPTRGAFSFNLGRAGGTVDYQSEAARIDLNQAPKELIAGLFRTLGAQGEEADYYADRIVGWRTKGQATADDPEATAYRVAGIAYAPRQGPFQSAAELWLVLGIPQILKDRALPFVTVYSGQAEVDTQNAAPEVIASQPNMNPERMGNVLQQRTGALPSGQAQPGTQPSAGQQLSGNAVSHSYRLNIRIVLDSGRRIAAEVVILVPEDGDDPYRVLYWRDDFDGLSS
ncbi:MAG: general secretion pathway protein GspK [Methylobacteriaceae bacterium]|nr:general secretion pathway protein GspK [Methylobacteriaceae bacterium]